MTNYNLREIEALERIATALEALAKGKDRDFTPALPDPHAHGRRDAKAKADAER